jgi:hypothetical protein
LIQNLRHQPKIRKKSKYHLALKTRGIDTSLDRTTFKFDVVFVGFIVMRAPMFRCGQSGWLGFS